MKPQFKTLSQQCSGSIRPIPGHNVKSNKRGFSFMKLLHFGFGGLGGSPVVETPHFLLSGRSGSETNQQILFVAVFSKQPLEILFATLILGWKAVRGGEPFSHGVSLVRVRQCGSYKKERESGGEEAVNFLRTNIGNVKNVNSVFWREILVFDKSKSVFDSSGWAEYLCTAFLWLWGLSRLAIVNISREEFAWEYRWPERKYWFGAVAPVAWTRSLVFM